MFTLEVLREAEFEITEACAWYERRQKGLGKRLLNELSYYLDLIINNPFQFPIRFSEIYRFCVLKIFPYFIVFKIDESKNTVLINSFFHTSRHPLSF